MNQNGSRIWQFNLPNLQFWLILLLIIGLLSSVGLGWLVKVSFFVIAFFLIAPVIVFLGFRWWLKRNLVVDNCPVCGYESAGINGTQMRCPNCSEPLSIQHSHFHRLTPPGTVDVTAVEVPTKQIDS